MYGRGGHLGHVTLDHLYKLSFPLAKEAANKILLRLAK